MRITADADQCVGAGQCVLAAPDVFDQDDDGLVMVLQPTPEGTHQLAVHAAADVCPSRSITLHSD